MEEEFQLRFRSLHKTITVLQYTDINQVPDIINELVSLSQYVLSMNDGALRNTYTPRVDNMYTHFMNKIDTFITLVEQ